jgi:DNA-binding transcriptional ArsR family regulator
MRDTVSDVFAALGDPTRRGIYEELLGAPDGRSATELAAAATISRQAIVKHLQVLVRAGLAATFRDGREVRYFARRDGARGASRWLIERTSEWDRRLASLEKRVDDSRRGT